jgi:hypothetical protein
MLISDYTDLTTPSIVADQSLGGLGPAIEEALRAPAGSGDTEEIQQTALRFIKSYTLRIEEFLNRTLMVRLRNFVWVVDQYSNAWSADSRYTLPSQDQRYSAYFSDWPVVQMLSVNADTNLADEMAIVGDVSDLAVIHFDDDLSDYPVQAVGYAGYRRQDLDPPGSGETWNDAFSTSALTDLDQDTDVPLLPSDIQAVCNDLVIASMRWESNRLVGVSESEMEADRMRVKTQKVTPGFVENELKKLVHYRKIPSS